MRIFIPVTSYISCIQALVTGWTEFHDTDIRSGIGTHASAEIGLISSNSYGESITKHNASGKKASVRAGGSSKPVVAGSTSCHCSKYQSSVYDLHFGFIIIPRFLINSVT